MSNPGPQHVCFYSNKCRLSEAFIKMLKDTPYKREFQFICVDGKVAELKRRYQWLERTPTLVIRGEEDPRTGNECLNWVSEMNIRTQGGGPTNGSPGSQEPEPWVGNEMGGGLTKGFSFLGANDEFEAPKGDFEYLNGQGSMGTRTGSDIPGGGIGTRVQKSSKEKLFDKQMEEYIRNRSNGMPQAPMRQ